MKQPRPPLDEMYGEDPEDWMYPGVYEDTLVIPTGNGGRGPITFGPNTRLQITVYLALGADLTADPSTWVFTNVTQYVRYEQGISCTSGRPDESSRVSPGSGGMMLDNTDGRFSRRNPLGPYYGLLSRNTPIKVEVNAGNGAYFLMRQYVNEWPVRFDKSLNNHYVPIRTGGILRRLQQGSSPASSAIRRALLGDVDLTQYYPCEEAEGAARIGSAVDGTYIRMDDAITPGTSISTGTGTDPLPTFTPGATQGIDLIGNVPPVGGSATVQWSAGIVCYFPTLPTLNNVVPVRLTTRGGTVWYSQLIWTGTQLQLTVYDYSVSLILTATGAPLSAANITGAWMTFWVSMENNGTGVDYAFGWERSTATGNTSSSAGGNLAAYQIGDLRSHWIEAVNATPPLNAGHMFTLKRAIPLGGNTPIYGAMTAWLNETAAERVRRTCAEEGIPFKQNYGQVPSGTMGYQPKSTGMDIVRECELVDGGVLYEDGFGLGFQPLAARYNAIPTMRLDFTRKEISEEPQPTDDDQGLRNKWTISNSNTSVEAVSTDEASIIVDGLHADSASLNLGEDDQCAQIASWLVHVGTSPDHRWPVLNLRFDNAAGVPLIPDWTERTAFGSRITVATPPYQLSPTAELIDVFIDGLTERVDQFTWTAALNTSPAPVNDVFVLDSPRYGHLDTDENGTYLNEAADATETDLIYVSSASRVNWVDIDVADQPLDFPFDLNLAGEQITVTANTAFAGPVLRFTVVRNVNGVSRDIDPATANVTPIYLSLWRPARLAL